MCLEAQQRRFRPATRMETLPLCVVGHLSLHPLPSPPPLPLHGGVVGFLQTHFCVHCLLQFGDAVRQQSGAGPGGNTNRGELVGGNRDRSEWRREMETKRERSPSERKRDEDLN